MNQGFEDFAAKSRAIAEETNYLVTPANAISVAGFALSMDGARHLDTWRGVVQTGVGFALDVVDGKVARATGTASPIGETVDASLDKIKTGYFASKLFLEGRAPKGLIGAVIGQNALNAAITLYDKSQNETPQVHPVKEGKWGMFAQNTGLGLHAVGTKLSETRPSVGRNVKFAGSIIGYSGVALSLVSSLKYARAAGLINNSN